MSYSQVPRSSSDSPSYPPIDPGDAEIPGTFKKRSSSTLSSRILPRSVKWIAITALTLILLHFAFLGVFPDSSYATRYHKGDEVVLEPEYIEEIRPANDFLDYYSSDDNRPGTLFRDAYPVRSMIAFWELAQKEVQEKGLDTCGDQLGAKLIDAYVQSSLPYCLPSGENGSIRLSPGASHGEQLNSQVWCAPVHRNSFSNWWPYPAAPCISTNLRTIPGEDRDFTAVGCDITADGTSLRDEMGRERFLGSNLNQPTDEHTGVCSETLNRTALVIGRQDQWNPFHVAEDLITTLVSVFIAARMSPGLINTRVQVIFAEGFGMDSNHFTPLWDRIGAWAPKRLSLDPWHTETCLTNTIHSVGAGASLLSAMGVGSSYTCASTITWAASHYYRHLFGLTPQTFDEQSPRNHINVLWLSRSKLDAYAQGHNQWSSWRSIRHIDNEPELLDRFRTGLRNMCSEIGGASGCVFQDAHDQPETWDDNFSDGPFALRFAAMDPTVHAIENQIHMVGHASILISSHGGALGLSLFLPPGQSVVMELQVSGVSGNYHFQHMAYETGQEYDLHAIDTTVNVDQIWNALEKWVRKLAPS